MKFPHNPARQRYIAQARPGMDAKKRAYAAGAKPMPDWDIIRIAAMARTLAEKLRQHPARFGNTLSETGNRPIVEKATATHSGEPSLAPPGWLAAICWAGCCKNCAMLSTGKTVVPRGRPELRQPLSSRASTGAQTAFLGTN